jgi:hypothetical protein
MAKCKLVEASKIAVYLHLHLLINREPLPLQSDNIK